MTNSDDHLILYGVERRNTGLMSRKLFGCSANSDYYQLKRFTVMVQNPWTGKKEKQTCYEGERCSLFFPSAHRYRWHPALWLQEFVLGNNLFCHIPEIEIAKAFAGQCNNWESPRISRCGGWNCKDLLRQYGLFCQRCKRPKWDDEDCERNEWNSDYEHLNTPSLEHWHWEDLGICKTCAAETKVEAVHRQQQVVLRESLFRERRRWWLEKKDQARRTKREMTTAVQQERRILERASYMLLDELGLINELRRRQNAESRNHRSEAPVMGKTQPPRRTTRRNIGASQGI